MRINNGDKISPTFCALPWVHLAFEPNGKVIPCCLTSDSNYFSGDLNTMTIEEVWNSDNMKKLRKQMMTGVEPNVCRKCFDKERVTPGESGRVYHNETFKSKIDEVKTITSEDGSCSKIDLKYWDFRFSNKCNFKCRSCGPAYSSNWVNDAKHLYHDNKDPGEQYDYQGLFRTKLKHTDTVDNESKFEFLKKQAANVQKIYFAGGEPLIMDEHYFILDMLLEQGRNDVELRYNTNTSNLTYKGKNVLDYWRKWDPNKIEVWPSIDEIGPRAELIRSGTIWPEVEANLKQIAELDILIRPGITTGAMNVFRLPEIVEHLISIGVIKEKYNYQNWFINMLVYPVHYHFSIFSDKFRAEIHTKLTNWIETMKVKYNTDLTEKFTYLFHHLSMPYDPKARQDFLWTTKKLDAIRGENIFEVIPEMKDTLVAPEPAPEEFAVKQNVVYSFVRCTCGKTKHKAGQCDGSHDSDESV